MDGLDKANGSDKKAYKPVTDNIVNYLGENSLISVDFLPNAFFIKDKDILYPFALNIEKIIIWTHSENVKEEISYKKHSYLSGFGMNVEYKGIEKQTDVPVYNVSEFNINNFSRYLKEIFLSIR